MANNRADCSMTRRAVVDLLVGLSGYGVLLVLGSLIGLGIVAWWL